MTQHILTATRTAMAQAIITAIGSGAKIELWNGTMPTALGTPGGTLLATSTFSTTIGTATAGGIDIDEASISQALSGGVGQSNGSHVDGTPTFARLTTSDGTVHYDISIGAGSDEWDFTGTVANGQNVTFTGLSLTMPAATA
jgi:hypothetical protein